MRWRVWLGRLALIGGRRLAFAHPTLRGKGTLTFQGIMNAQESSGKTTKVINENLSVFYHHGHIPQRTDVGRRVTLNEEYICKLPRGNPAEPVGTKVFSGILRRHSQNSHRRHSRLHRTLRFHDGIVAEFAVAAKAVRP